MLLLLHAIIPCLLHNRSITTQHVTKIYTHTHTHTDKIGGGHNQCVCMHVSFSTVFKVLQIVLALASLSP